MTDGELQERVKAFLDEQLSNIHGQWTTALFDHSHDLRLSDRKVLFFQILKRLLEMGEIRFIHPDETANIMWVDGIAPVKSIQDPMTHWNDSLEAILTFLMAQWPNGVSNPNSMELNEYFYTIPPIIWRSENGHWVGS